MDLARALGIKVGTRALSRVIITHSDPHEVLPGFGVKLYTNLF